MADASTATTQKTAALGLVAVVLVLYFFSSDEASPSTLLGEVSAAPVYAIRHVRSGKYLGVTRIEGTLHAYANRSAEPRDATRFRIVPMGATAVRRLFEQASRFEALALKSGRFPMTTRSGCRCSGFSSEHGFGRYCEAWENSYQDAWCYVNDTCTSASVTKGSFGRRHDYCTPDTPPPSPPLPPLPPSPPSPSPPPPGIKAYPLGTTWAPPEGCSCSGFSNKHGFGGHCKAWESRLEGGEEQLPWCYVAESQTCDVALSAGRIRRKKGSFGRLYADCVPTAPTQAQALGAALGIGGAERKPLISRLFGRRLGDVQARGTKGGGHSKQHRPAGVGKGSGVGGGVGGGRYAGLSRKEKRSTAHEREEAVLLRRISRAARFVSIVSEATQGFLTAELPPHKHALRPYALESRVSLGSVFSLLPDGGASGAINIASMGTVAMLNLCERDAICTGYKPDAEPNYKLLRVLPAGSAAKNVAHQFVLERL